MAKTTKENVRLKKKEYDRKRREKMKSDPVANLKLKEKERIKYLKKKEKGQVLEVSKMSTRSLRKKRNQWRKNSRNYRESLKNKKHDSVVSITEEGIASLSGSAQTESQAGEQKAKRKISARKKAARKRSKMLKRIEDIKHKLKIEKSRAERYKKKCLRLIKKHNIEKSQSIELTPRSKVNKFLVNEKVSSPVRKRLVYGTALQSQLEENYKKLGVSYKSKQLFSRIISGKILKKYKALCSIKSFTSKRFKTVGGRK